MNRELLEQPFPSNLVKSRQGSFGNRLNYVEVAEIVKRLNSALEGAWSFAIRDLRIMETEVLVHGALTAEGIEKHGIGGSKITYTRGSGEIVSIVDDCKAAASDALKRCARLLGVGLDLYSDTRPAAETGNGRQKSAQGGNGQHRRNGGNGGNGRTDNRLTQKQLSAIWSLGRSLGLNADAIRQRAQEAYSAMPEHLSKSDASSFISALGAELSGDGGVA